MKLPITLMFLTLLFVGEAADAGRRSRDRRRKRPRPVPTQPAPEPDIAELPDGTFTGVLGGRLITFTATPMAFLTLYGDLEVNDPEIASAYVSGNYNNYLSHMGIVFIYLAHDGSIHHSETYSGTYIILSDGTIIFTGVHGTAFFSKIG